MKNKILLFLLLCNAACFAQNVIYTGSPTTGTIYNGVLGANGAFILPDGNEGAIYPNVRLRGRQYVSTVDNRLTFHDGTGYKKALTTADMGAPFGVPTLDENSKIPLSLIPDALVGAVIYQGTYNASNNTPALGAATGKKGWYYKINTAGTQQGSTFAVGDWVISNGTVWEKLVQTFPVDTGINSGSNNAVSGGAVYAALQNYVQLTGKSNQTISGGLQVTGFLQQVGTSGIATGGLIVADQGVSSGTQVSIGSATPASASHATRKDYVDAADGVLNAAINGKANANGSNASGTWPINITGNATNWTDTGVTDFNTPTGFKLLTASSGAANRPGVGQYGSGIQFQQAGNPTFSTQLVSDVTGMLYTRFQAGSGYNPWNQLAFTDGDVFSRSYTDVFGITSTGATGISINGGSQSDFDLGVAGSRTFNINTTATENTITTYGSKKLFVTVNGGIRQTFDTNGNVGIGTTAPSYKLDVNGTGRFTGILKADANIDISGSSYIGFNSNTWTVNHSSGGLNFVKQGTGSGMFLGDNLNVGIGTTTPTSRLDVWDNTNPDLLTGRVGSASVPAFVLGGHNSNISNAGLYIKTLRAGTMTEAMRISHDGNVGINTTNPTEKLHVVGNSIVSGNSTVNGTFTIDGSGYSLAQFRSSGINRGYIGQGDYAITGGSSTGFGIGAINDLQLGAGNTIRATINASTGNMSIGSASTNAKLSVADGTGGNQFEMKRGSGRVLFGMAENLSDLLLYGGASGSETLLQRWFANGDTAITGTIAHANGTASNHGATVGQLNASLAGKANSDGSNVIDGSTWNIDVNGTASNANQLGGYQFNDSNPPDAGADGFVVKYGGELRPMSVPYVQQKLGVDAIRANLTVSIPATAANTYSSASGITVMGAQVGDFVQIVTNLSYNGGIIYHGHVTAANTVTIHRFNGSSSGLSAGDIDMKIKITK